MMVVAVMLLLALLLMLLVLQVLVLVLQVLVLVLVQEIASSRGRQRLLTAQEARPAQLSMSGRHTPHSTMCARITHRSRGGC